MSLKNYSDKELMEELERRKKLKANLPKPLMKMGWYEVQKLAENYIAHITEYGYEPKDAEHYIFEGVMETVYGKNIWDYINDIL